MPTRFKSLALVVLIAAFFLGGFTPVSATAPGPDVLVQVSGQPLSYITTYSPDGSNRLRLDFDNWLRVSVSPNNRWIAAAGVNPANNSPVMAYRAVNGRPVNIPVDRGYDLFGMTFTDDSRFLMYTTVSMPAQGFVIGLVNLTNGIRAEFAGTYGARSVFGPNSAAFPLRFDGRNMILQGYIPFSDGGYTGLFRVNLTGYDTAPAGRYLIPPAQRILGTGTVGQIEFSPDGRQIAVLYYDPTNPPQNHVGPFSVNGLAVVDLGNPVPRVIAKAGAGQGLETLAWSPDGRTIYITGGSYQGRAYISNPGFYAVDVATGQVRQAGQLSTDPEEAFYQVHVCGSNAFFIANAEARPSTLFSAPVDNIANRRQIVSGPQGLEILSCATR